MVVATSSRLERSLKAGISLVSLVISAISLNYAVVAFNIASNYPPSVQLENVSPLVLTETCSPAPSTPSPIGNLTTRNCSVKGAFNVSFSIVSPHAGTYNVSVQSFSLVPAYLPMENLTFLGRNLTLVSFNVSDIGYMIKARNETSGHLAYFVFIGSLPPPAWTIQTQFEIGGDHVGIVTANGFERTAVIAVTGMVHRFGDSSGHMEHLGTLTAVLTYHDVPLGRNIHQTFTVDVLLLT